MKYVRDSVTSYQGAVDNLPRSGTQKARILEAIELCEDYGCLREDLERPLGLSGNAVRPRVVELIEAGLVKETKRTRRTRSGSQATVLVAATNVGSSTEDRDQAEKNGPQPVNADLGVASGVETGPFPPEDSSSPPESLFDPPPAPNAFDPWERAA